MMCKKCNTEQRNIFRAEIEPDDLYDDATLRILLCKNGHFEGIIIQSERRGSLDDETIQLKEFSPSEKQVNEIVHAAIACPNLQNAMCTCSWHKKVNAKQNFI